MPVFNLLKPTDVNSVDLTSLENALATIKKDHDTNLTKYNNLVTQLYSLPVHESEKSNIDKIFKDLQTEIDGAKVNGSMHLAGDIIAQKAINIITNKELQQKISNNANYEDYIKAVDAAKIPTATKEMYKQNAYINGLNSKTGKWEAPYKISQHIDINDIEKDTENNLVKAMQSYGDIYYRTENGDYTIDSTIASSSQPYYFKDGTFIPLNMEKVRSNMKASIYRNPVYLESLKQEYETYKYQFENNELRNNNPAYNGTTPLTFDEFIEKSINGFYNNQKLNIYYSNKYVNPAVVNNSKTGKNVIIGNANGEPIQQLTEKEIKAVQEEQTFKKQIEKNKNSVILQDDKPYNANNTKNLFDGYEASKGYLQNLLDVINQKLSKDKQLQIENKSYNDVEKFVTNYYESNNIEIPFELTNALDKYKHSLQLTENILNNISKKSGIRYYNLALRYYIDNGINLLPNDDEFIEYINLYNNSKYYGEQHKIKDYNAATQYSYHPQLGIPIGKYIPTTYKTGFTKYDFVVDGNYFNIGDEKYNISKYLEDDLDTPIKSISNIDLYRGYAGATSDNVNEVDIQRRVKTSLDREASAISLLGRNGANFDVYVGDKLNSSNKNDIDGVKRNAVGSLISYIYDNFKDYINISYDTTNLNGIISIRRPSFKEYINKDNKKIIEAAEQTINNYLEKAGLSHIEEGDNITVIVPNFMNSGLKDEHLNNPLIESTQEITQLLYSNLDEYSFDEDIRKAKITFDKHIVDGKVKKGDLEQTLFDAGGTKVNITRDEMIKYRNAEKSFIYLKNKYKDITNDYNLSEKEALDIIVNLTPLFPDIIKDISLNDKAKNDSIINGIYTLLGEINGSLVNKFKQLTNANK